MKTLNWIIVISALHYHNYLRVYFKSKMIRLALFNATDCIPAGDLNDISNYLWRLRRRLKVPYKFRNNNETPATPELLKLKLPLFFNPFLPILVKGSLWKTLTMKALLCLWRTALQDPLTAANQNTDRWGTKSKITSKLLCSPLAPAALNHSSYIHHLTCRKISPLTKVSRLPPPPRVHVSQWMPRGCDVWVGGGVWSEAVQVCMICNIKPALQRRQSCTLILCQAFFWYGKVITGRKSLRSCYMTYCWSSFGPHNIWGEGNLKCW